MGRNVPHGSGFITRSSRGVTHDSYEDGVSGGYEPVVFRMFGEGMRGSFVLRLHFLVAWKQR